MGTINKREARVVNFIAFERTERPKIENGAGVPLRA